MKSGKAIALSFAAAVGLMSTAGAARAQTELMSAA